MKLWEIKAQALRLMFADTDIQFSELEFSNGSIRQNPNTREKLVRMEDSIRRAIDYYYQYCGNITQTAIKQLKVIDGVYFNEILTSSISNFGFPVKIDIFQDLETGIRGVDNVPFNFDVLTKNVFFTENDFVREYNPVLPTIKFQIYYKIAQENIPMASNELTYDLNVLNIPEEVQRSIPLYVKGELYEEDEAVIASSSKSQFFQFLMAYQRKSFMKVQTKVKNRYLRSSR
jgi:hypothetical protein